MAKIIHSDEQPNRIINTVLLDKKNPTNGDVIKAIFPNAKDYGIDNGLAYMCLDNRTITIFTSSWWNSSYTGHWG